MRLMDSNLTTAIVTAIAIAGSSTTVAIVAILQTNKGFDDMREWIQGDFKGVSQRFDFVDRQLEDLRKRLDKLEADGAARLVPQ